MRFDDEAEYITSRIDERGRMGEAYRGATKNWDIVDVPPGTERVRMDGVGGGAAEVTWSKYSGVRRAKFLPDGDTVVSAPPVSRPRERERERETDTRINVQIIDDKKEKPPVKEKRSDMWTEITKDLVSRAAIEEMGYEYEETEFFYYILTYLRYVSYSFFLLLLTIGISLTTNRRTSSSWSNCRTVSDGHAKIASARSGGSVITATTGTRTTNATDTARAAATRTSGSPSGRSFTTVGRRSGVTCARRLSTFGRLDITKASTQALKFFGVTVERHVSRFDDRSIGSMGRVHRLYEII